MANFGKFKFDVIKSGIAYLHIEYENAPASFLAIPQTDLKDFIEGLNHSLQKMKEALSIEIKA